MAHKILIVDDEPIIIKLLKTRLEASNYEIVTAYDGQEALDKTYQEKPDLIILDVTLPKIDGYNVATTLKSKEIFKNIPILMLTGSEDVNKAIKSGAVCFIKKPFQSNVLLGIIQGLINGKKL